MNQESMQETGETPQEKLGLGARVGRSFGRMTGVFFSPAATFRDIGRSSDWLVPFLVIMVATLVLTNLTLPYLDLEGEARASLADSGLPPDQVETRLQQQQQFMESFGSILIYGSGTIGGTIVFVVLALIYWAGTNAFGGRITFGITFSVVLYAWMIRLVEGILRVVVLQGRDPVFPSRLDMVLATNPAAFMSTDAQGTVLYALARTLNIFTLWTMGLLAIGLSEAGKLSRGAAYGLVGILFGLYVAIYVGWTAAFG